MVMEEEVVTCGSLKSLVYKKLPAAWDLLGRGCIRTMYIAAVLRDASRSWAAGLETFSRDKSNMPSNNTCAGH